MLCARYMCSRHDYIDLSMRVFKTWRPSIVGAPLPGRQMATHEPCSHGNALLVLSNRVAAALYRQTQRSRGWLITNNEGMTNNCTDIIIT